MIYTQIIQIIPISCTNNTVGSKHLKKKEDYTKLLVTTS